MSERLESFSGIFFFIDAADNFQNVRFTAFYKVNEGFKILGESIATAENVQFFFENDGMNK